jgi:hypothetical protein
MLPAQALQGRNDCLLIHLHRVGDHTRGLFEAEASIAISTAHTLEDVKIFFFIGHCALQTWSSLFTTKIPLLHRPHGGKKKVGALSGAIGAAFRFTVRKRTRPQLRAAIRSNLR